MFKYLPKYILIKYRISIIYSYYYVLISEKFLLTFKVHRSNEGLHLLKICNAENIYLILICFVFLILSTINNERT